MPIPTPSIRAAPVTGTPSASPFTTPVPPLSYGVQIVAFTPSTSFQMAVAVVEAEPDHPRDVADAEADVVDREVESLRGGGNRREQRQRYGAEGGAEELHRGSSWGARKRTPGPEGAVSVTHAW